MPSTYASTASFVPENPRTPRLSGSLAGLASQFGFNIGAEASRSPAFYADMLRSREVLGAVLEAKIARTVDSTDSVSVYDLYKVRDELPERRLEEGLRAFRKRISVTVDQRTDIVRLTVEAPTPASARGIADLVLARLAEFNLHTRQSTAAEKRRFIEARVTETEKELRAAEEALRSFYEQNRLLQASPQLRFEEQRLTRQVSIQQDLYLTLRREYELSRVEEVDNTPVLTVIDRPQVPGRRIKPVRTATVLLVSLAVWILAALLALILQYQQDLLASGDPEYLRFHHRLSELFRRHNLTASRTEPTEL